MKVGIIGLPQSGKTTVFSAATGKPVDPFAPSEVRQAIVQVPDPRLDFLAQQYKPKKITEATIEFLDIPGVSLDNPRSQDELRALMPTMKLCEMLAVVVRDFENPSVPAYRDRIDPIADLNEVWNELIFADLDAVTVRLERLEKSLARPSKTRDADKKEMALLERCREALEAEQPLSTLIKSEEDSRQVASFAFLTQKPLVCVRNVSDDKAGDNELLEAEHFTGSVALSASIEAEIASLDADDRATFLADLGLSESARDRLVRTCYSACGLIAFLTAGPDEVRAWSIAEGDSAVQAAGKIHTDLARGFVRAETVAFADLVEHGDMKSAKAAGKVRMEGKSYIVADGDVMTIHHS